MITEDFNCAVLEYAKLFSTSNMEAIKDITFYCAFYRINNLKYRHSKSHGYLYETWRIFLYCKKNNMELPRYGSNDFVEISKIARNSNLILM